MSCDIGEATEGLVNDHSVTSPTSQLILQPFRRFAYVTAHSPSLPLLHLRHNSLSNPSFASPTAQVLRLRHLASRPCCFRYLKIYSVQYGSFYENECFVAFMKTVLSMTTMVACDKFEIQAMKAHGECGYKGPHIRSLG